MRKPWVVAEYVFLLNLITLIKSILNRTFTIQNWEFQVYDNSRSNSFTKDSILHIKPTLTEDRYGAGFVTTGTLDLNGGAPADE
jgi:hypothetical protein